MKCYTLWETDIWLTRSSFTLCGIFSSLNEAVSNAKANQLLTEFNQVVIKSGIIGDYENTSQKVFSTENDGDRAQLQSSENTPNNSQLSDRQKPSIKDKYVVAEWPESQLFIGQYQDQIFLINDAHGREKFGLSAYFVKETLYNKVMSDFDKEGLFPKPDIG